MYPVFHPYLFIHIQFSVPETETSNEKPYLFWLSDTELQKWSSVKHT